MEVPQQMIRLSLRFDDPSAISDRALEEGIFAAAQTAGIPITVAVIPFRRQESGEIPLTQERAAHLIDAQRAGVIEVAQHGYCHVSARGEKLPHSEFMGVDAACQTERICAGKMLLETVFDKPSSVSYHLEIPLTPQPPMRLKNSSFATFPPAGNWMPAARPVCLICLVLAR